MPVQLLQNPDLEFALRLLLSALCGGVIGVERTRRNKGAGIKTHMLVAVGAALFVILSKYGFLDVIAAEGADVDVSRVAAGVTTGVGFLGGGIIFLRGTSVQGLTTAAGIWVMAAAGCAFGAGMYSTGLVVTAIVLVVQLLFKNENFPHLASTYTGELTVTMDEDSGNLKVLEAMLYERNVDIVNTHIKKHKEGTITYTFTVVMPETLDVAETVSQIYKTTGAKSIDL